MASGLTEREVGLHSKMGQSITFSVYDVVLDPPFPVSLQSLVLISEQKPGIPRVLFGSQDNLEISKLVNK